jgi:sucrose phosphorylase
MELRNSEPAFGLEGKIDVTAEGDRLTITRSCSGRTVTLRANLTTYEFTIE